jgi:hypothetical protein
MVATGSDLPDTGNRAPATILTPIIDPGPGGSTVLSEPPGILRHPGCGRSCRGSLCEKASGPKELCRQDESV